MNKKRLTTAGFFGVYAVVMSFLGGLYGVGGHGALVFACLPTAPFFVGLITWPIVGGMIPVLNTIKRCVLICVWITVHLCSVATLMFAYGVDEFFELGIRLFPIFALMATFFVAIHAYVIVRVWGSMKEILSGRDGDNS